MITFCFFIFVSLCHRVTAVGASQRCPPSPAQPIDSFQQRTPAEFVSLLARGNHSQSLPPPHAPAIPGSSNKTADPLQLSKLSPPAPARLHSPKLCCSDKYPTVSSNPESARRNPPYSWLPWLLCLSLPNPGTWPCPHSY